MGFRSWPSWQGRYTEKMCSDKNEKWYIFGFYLVVSCYFFLSCCGQGTSAAQESVRPPMKQRRDQRTRCIPNMFPYVSKWPRYSKHSTSDWTSLNHVESCLIMLNNVESDWTSCWIIFNHVESSIIKDWSPQKTLAPLAPLAPRCEPGILEKVDWLVVIE